MPELLGWGVQPLVFDTVLHLGTALALVIFFFGDLINAVFKNRKILWFLLLGSIPAGLLGYFFEHYFENVFRGIGYVILFLFLGTILMAVAEKFSRVKAEEVTGIKAFVIGLFQSLALFPGFSRSGSTISGGMLLGLKREEAARFSFLLSIPIVVGATIYKVISSFEIVSGISYLVLGMGFISSFLVGILAIRFLLNFLKKNSLNWFVLYRVLLILFLLVVNLI